MKKMRSVAFAVVTAALAACSSGGSGPTGSGNPSPSGQTVSVPVGGEGVVPGTQVTIDFRAVTEDSRCPSNVVCVWAGNGQVALTLSTPSDARDALLNTTSEPRRIEFAGIRITLASLAPYPSGEPIDPDDYVATFEVEPD
jgi:hypothetical protein